MISKISKITDNLSLKFNRNIIIKNSINLKIPYFLLYFLIYIEDKRFYYHIGIDLLAISRAFIMNKQKCKLQGGSTLTQQLYDIIQEKKGGKRERNLKRKYKQVMFALKYTRKKTKEKIIKEYLENVYFGRNCYGINIASKSYFKKEVFELNKIECFVLIQKIASPNKLNLKRLENILKRNSIKNIFSLNEIQELKKNIVRENIYG